jgi:hypothetical protein
MTIIRTGLAVATLSLGAAAATAQGTGGRPTIDPTPRLAREALALCLPGAPQPATTIASPER